MVGAGQGREKGGQKLFRLHACQEGAAGAWRQSPYRAAPAGALQYCKIQHELHLVKKIFLDLKDFFKKDSAAGLKCGVSGRL
jgi:hypothetical protein